MESEISVENSPFIKAFTLAVIKAIYYSNFHYVEPRRIINADLIPRIPQQIVEKRIFEEKKIIHYPKPKGRVMPIPPAYQIVSGEFGKIDSLLKDPTVTTIECPGENKNVFVVRSGLRQPTKILLSKDEIHEILKKVAEIARVPLIEGVFRASIRDFVLDSIVSKTIGSRFVIKKYNPYALLELDREKRKA
jgi:hypothetical protein